VKFAKRCGLLLVAVFCTVWFFGCTRTPPPDITAGTQYTLLEIRPGEFFYSNSAPILLSDAGNTGAFAEFNANFSKMTLVTIHRNERIEFLVTSFSQRNGQINGTMSRIGIDGRVVRYKLHSDNSFIYVDALVRYDINVDLNVGSPNNTVTIERELNVLIFARSK
jgi:hypothetical protein